MTLAHTLILVATTCLLGPSHAIIPFQDWQCGSEETSRRMAYDTVMESCPDFAPEMNHCCVIHDDCYSKQLGQDKCDEDFCQCNKRSLNRTGGEGCMGQAEVVCIIMPMVGSFAYTASENYTEPEDLPKHVPIWPALTTSYGSLYSACPSVNSTLSSCAIMLNECSGPAYTCADQLCNCINGAYRSDGSATCRHSISEVCSVAIQEGNYWRMFHMSPHPLVLSFLTLIATFCALGVALCLIYLWFKERNSGKSIKYTVVN